MKTKTIPEYPAIVLNIDIRSRGDNAYVRQFYCPPYLDVKEKYWEDIPFHERDYIYQCLNSIMVELPTLDDGWEH